MESYCLWNTIERMLLVSNDGFCCRDDDATGAIRIIGWLVDINIMYLRERMPPLDMVAVAVERSSMKTMPCSCSFSTTTMTTTTMRTSRTMAASGGTEWYSWLS